MSQCYDIVCVDCKVRRPSIGQSGGSRVYFYSDMAVVDFLREHPEHRIRLFGEFDHNEEIETQYEVSRYEEEGG